MTNDLISQAEALIEKHDTSGYIHRDATLLLPGLVSEIKRLQDENDYLRNGTCLGCVAKLEELAKWQQIAIKQRALINFIETEERYAYSEHVILSDDEMSIAAKELGLQGYKTAHEPDGPIEINGERYVKESEQKAYVERLEEAFLDAYHAKIYYGRIYYKKDPGAREERIAETHAALEKIRRG